MTLTDMLAFVSTAILARFEGPRPEPDPEPTISLAEHDARVDALERQIDALERRVDELLDENRRLHRQIGLMEWRHRAEHDALMRHFTAQTAYTPLPPVVISASGGGGGGPSPLTTVVGVGGPLVARRMDEATQRRLMEALNSQQAQAMMQAQQITPMLDFCNCVPARHDAFRGVMLGDISE
jgi:TolA-binding protein